jgi:hypothetical protein
LQIGGSSPLSRHHTSMKLRSNLNTTLALRWHVMYIPFPLELMFEVTPMTGASIEP